jgi:integrase
MIKSHRTPDPRPDKPSPDFPLFAHAAGVWAKKIRGKFHYFGPWDDPAAALARYNEQKEALHTGKKPRPDREGVTVKDIANAFLNHKQTRLDAGELSPHTWADYRRVTDLVVAHLGKGRLVSDVGPDDFAPLRDKLARRWGPHRLGKFVQFTRSLFKFAYDAELIDRPTRFGPGFDRPSKKTLRLNKAGQGTKLFTADEVRRLLDAAGVQVKAMILLGINAGFGNSDCGKLPLTALNLDTGWLDYPRPKTGIARRCPLWPETVAALREAIARRPKPKDEADGGLVFVTKYGGRWFKDTPDNPITKEIAKLLRALGINGHRNFYCLRHTFRTVADECKDQVAADHVMGHEIQNMSAAYRERVSDQRLRAVVDHVRGWLFGTTAAR